MPAVQKLTITGYKSIRELRDFELRNLNVLIGANGAGKSNFIGVFRMLAELLGGRFQSFVQREGGPDALLHYSRQVTDRIVAEFYFGDVDMYCVNLAPTKDNRLVFDEEFLGSQNHATPARLHYTRTSDESQAARLNGTLKSLVDAAFASTRVYHFHDTSATAKVKQLHSRDDTLRLKNDGSNLAAYLQMLRVGHPAQYETIVRTIRLAAPFFDDFVDRPHASTRIQLEWLEKGDPDTPFNAHALSDGTLRFICLCTLLLQPWNLMPETILIDEPELGLHPYAIALLADLIKRAAERKQLVVSTQSVELINLMAPEDIVVVDRRDNASTFQRLDSASLEHWLDDYSLGQLWNMNVLGGRPA
ncbi:AAA family ATPase [Caballeronia novacaledonica]|uniref:AAA family ATPase n=1 Tax=Caballeronia novacaledonica TaxID=1544861 RepID=UPI001EE1816E|nr:AAA family ATPase [Caballeronia novacaledonica]GJH07548.1 AAA family ATPase [Caballeronia novacaledonica]